MTAEGDFLLRLANQEAILVKVQSHRGSVPREAGAWMAVFADVCVGTIGGGHLEWQAMAQARAQLQGAPVRSAQVFQLGPSLGQCCGGEVTLQFAKVSAADVPDLRLGFERGRQAFARVALFGAGHVGQALVRVLAPLPLQLHWVDSRDDVFVQPLPETVCIEQSYPVQAAVAGLASQTHVLIMSFSHAEDLELVAACLARQRGRADLPFVGLIGSRTKWARFCHRLQARGFSAEELAHVSCPIGLPGITGKSPEMIAVAVAAQLLQVMSQRTA